LNVDVIQLILGANSDAIFEKCVNGYLPLHLAFDWGASVETMELLLCRYPGAASIVNEEFVNEEWTEFILHRALREGKEERLVLALLDAYPEAAFVKGRFGSLPLHDIVSSNQYSINAVKR
jgi:ankyrin repeat protein